MRILHIANFSLLKYESVFYAIDRKITNGLIRNGHFVSEFSYRDMAKCLAPFKIKKLGVSKMNQAIFETIKHLEPELILFGHSELIDTKTIQHMKELFPDIKLAMWWVDWLKNLSSIQSKIGYLDVLFTTTGIHAVDQSLLKHNAQIAYLPNMCDDSIEVYKAFDNKVFQNDLFFAGRVDKERVEFFNKLKQQLDAEIIFKMYGMSKKTLLQGNMFLKTIGQSKMSINLSRDHETSLYTSDRLIQLAANGTLVLTKKIPDFEILFGKDEIIFFENIDDLSEKAKFYNKNNSQRERISYNGWEKAHTSYNSTRVTKYMIETIFNLPYSENYEWRYEILKPTRKETFR